MRKRGLSDCSGVTEGATGARFPHVTLRTSLLGSLQIFALRSQKMVPRVPPLILQLRGEGMRKKKVKKMDFMSFESVHW